MFVIPFTVRLPIWLDISVHVRNLETHFIYRLVYLPSTKKRTTQTSYRDRSICPAPPLPVTRTGHSKHGQLWSPEVNCCKSFRKKSALLCALFIGYFTLGENVFNERPRQKWNRKSIKGQKVFPRESSEDMGEVTNAVIDSLILPQLSHCDSYKRNWQLGQLRTRFR